MLEFLNSVPMITQTCSMSERWKDRGGYAKRLILVSAKRSHRTSCNMATGIILLEYSIFQLPKKWKDMGFCYLVHISLGGQTYIAYSTISTDWCTGLVTESSTLHGSSSLRLILIRPSCIPKKNRDSALKTTTTLRHSTFQWCYCYCWAGNGKPTYGLY